MRCCLLTIFITVLLSLVGTSLCQTPPVWTYECVSGYCQKRRVIPNAENTAVSLAACQLFCVQYGALWPRPTGEISIDKALSHVNYNSINFIEDRNNQAVNKLIQANGRRLKEKLENIATPRAMNSGGKPVRVLVRLAQPSELQLTLNTDESYTLDISESANGILNVEIKATTYFGARHGLETLSQLIIYDDFEDKLLVPSSVYITDKPVYPYRGVMLDTGRNYISVSTIKRTIDAMSASKLNTLHWHMTDSASFPYVSKSQPQLSILGAYSSKKIYTPDDIEDIMEYARIGGVRVLPELDAPAHVGEGWQDTGFVTCLNEQPWQRYCASPPCGQLDPTKAGLYDTLEDIYKDIVEQFNPDIFHMGGDEVSISCWNTNSDIVEWMNSTRNWGRNEEDFVKLWNEFQSQALERFDKHTNKTIPIIVWDSTLTKQEYVEQYLPKDRYIIQIWTTADDPVINELLEKDYKLILSNYDALYLDCGFGSWVGEGNNWCSPYIGWQKVYENSPAEIGGERKNQFLGGEAALWTEQVDDTEVDGRIWPRAAALAERLWVEPESRWRDAEPRMLIHRQRLVSRGIRAEALEPEWCRHYQENCPNGGIFNQLF